jgi:protein-L-isoaspartate(D-aspartate) O-methyltransferase
MRSDAMIRRRTVLALAAVAAGRAAAQPSDEFAAARARLRAAIERDVFETASSTGRRELDARVMAAIERVPRHRFVPPQWAHLAYSNRPLPIGHGQTISQPFIVALMTDLAEIAPTDRVLEIGTGSGYQAAVLAELAARVYTIEIVRPLGERAAELLQALGYRDVETRIGDGYRGWPEAAPFDAIVVTAAPEKMPQPLIDQLAPGGRLVAPIGPDGGHQQLLVLTKQPDGRTVTRSVLGVRFVPLTRER